MSIFNSNKFIIEVSDTQPSYIRITHGKITLHGIKGDELEDLQRALKKAIKQSKLPFERNGRID